MFARPAPAGLAAEHAIVAAGRTLNLTHSGTHAPSEVPA